MTEVELQAELHVTLGAPGALKPISAGAESAANPYTVKAADVRALVALHRARQRLRIRRIVAALRHRAGSGGALRQPPDPEVARRATLDQSVPPITLTYVFGEGALTSAPRTQMPAATVDARGLPAASRLEPLEPRP